jgi:hypothetical protein
MKTLLLIITLALGLVLIIGAEKPVVASSEFSSSLDVPGMQPIRALKRAGKDEIGVSPTIRDPFSSVPPASPAPEQTSTFIAPVQVKTAQPLPAFQILGKQEDDQGWAVFISAPDKPGQVWVVREGDAFHENFRVSKLAPPLLIIKSTRNSQSRSFNIGKDEE